MPASICAVIEPAIKTIPHTSASEAAAQYFRKLSCPLSALVFDFADRGVSETGTTPLAVDSLPIAANGSRFAMFISYNLPNANPILVRTLRRAALRSQPRMGRQLIAAASTEGEYNLYSTESKWYVILST